MRTSSSSCRYSFNVKLHKPKLLDLKFQEKATEICIKESLYTFQPVLYLYLLVMAKLHITTTIVGCNRFRSLQFFSKHLVLLLISESTFLFNFFFLQNWYVHYRYTTNYTNCSTLLLVIISSYEQHI